MHACSQLWRFARLRFIVTRRYREDVRANWNKVSLVLWLVYLGLFAHW
jgi:hypothetical protein